MNQFELNQQIADFIKNKDQSSATYTEDDRLYIKQYSGSGGQISKGAKGEGVLHEFYTPPYVCSLMWQLANYYGFSGGYVLDNSCAIGNMFADAPDKSKCVGFEINPVTARISEILYPEAKIYNKYFETAFLQAPRFTSLLPKNQLTWLEQYPFSLVIANFPYGKYTNLYSSFFRKPKFAQIEQFFMYYSLLLLRQGGLFVIIISSNFMRNGSTYNEVKDIIGGIANFVDAYRLPAVFEFSEVPTDILVFKRK